MSFIAKPMWSKVLDFIAVTRWFCNGLSCSFLQRWQLQCRQYRQWIFHGSHFNHCNYWRDVYILHESINRLKRMYFPQVSGTSIYSLTLISSNMLNCSRNSRSPHFIKSLWNQNPPCRFKICSCKMRLIVPKYCWWIL